MDKYIFRRFTLSTCELIDNYGFIKLLQFFRKKLIALTSIIPVQNLPDFE